MPVPATPPSRDTLIELGRRHRVSYLTLQAGYTLGIAAHDGAPLVALLPSGFLDHIATLRTELDTLAHDKANAAEESRNQTGAQADALRTVKVAKRRMAKRAQRAARFGYSLPDALTHVGRSRNVPEAFESLNLMVGHFQTNIDAMRAAGAGADSLLSDAQAALANLKSADATQEVQRLATLPDSVRSYLAKKGELYLAIKTVNDAAHELHAAEPTEAAKYNLSILHRHAGKAAAPATPGAPTTPAAPAAPSAPAAPPAAPPHTGSALLVPLFATAILTLTSLAYLLIR